MNPMITRGARLAAFAAVSIVAGAFGVHALRAKDTPIVRAASQAAKAAASTVPDGKVFQDTIEAPASMRPARLCELVKYFNGGAGLYKVERMTARKESKDNVTRTYSYVQLTRVEAWTPDAPTTTVARIIGGANDDGSITTADVELHTSEVIGVLLLPATAENNGYPRLHTLGVFRSRAGNFSNGQLFTSDAKSTKEVGQLVAGLAGRADCPYDAEPDSVKVPSSPASGDVQIVGETVGLQQLPDLKATPTVGKVFEPAKGPNSESAMQR
ncbi:MAG TPA: hypothetical protein VFX59_23220 [Polyangiales bacterium]|nr:hypothetical protein [Polyangiales bacterium]